MSQYEEMEAFVRTVEAGSFTAAARQLKLAKSAVSRRVSEMEARLGVQLLTRSTRRLSLTEDGEALYRRGRALLEDWDEAEAVVSDRQQSLKGTIRIAAPLSFGIRHLGPALLDFVELHPDIIYDIDFSDRKIDLIAEGVDLALRIGELEDSSLIAVRLAPVRMLIAASPDYLARNGTPGTLAELREHGELRYANRGDRPWTVAAPDGHAETVTLPAVMHATNGDFLTGAAVRGQGIVIQPSFLICDELRDGRLKQVLPDHKIPDIGLYAVYPPTRHLSRRVRELVDFLKSRLGPEPYWDRF